MNVLVTGANGFVGSALCKVLAEKGVQVTAVTRHSVTSSDNLSIVNKDITKDTNWKSTLENIQTITHLANRAHVMKESADNPYLAYKVINVDATINLARQAIEAGVGRFIYISSIKVNGERTTNKPYTELDAPRPEDDYGKSKYEAEEALKALCKGTNMELVIIRPPLIYGPSVKANFLNLMNLCNKHIPLPFGCVQNKRSLVYIENLTSFIMVCLTHPNAANETFLVSDNDDQSTASLIRAIKNTLNRPTLLLPVPIFALEFIFSALNKKNLLDRLINNLHVDTSKSQTLLDWHPPYSFKEGIRATVDGFEKRK